MRRKLCLLLIFMNALFCSNPVLAYANYISKHEPGIYVFVSFSMNDESLRRYFLDSKEKGGKLVFRGLVPNSETRDRFAKTKEKLTKARINADINPVLFKDLKIDHVPAIAVILEDDSSYKVSGHITFDKAMEIIKSQMKPVIENAKEV